MANDICVSLLLEVILKSRNAFSSEEIYFGRNSLLDLHAALHLTFAPSFGMVARSKKLASVCQSAVSSTTNCKYHVSIATDGSESDECRVSKVYTKDSLRGSFKHILSILAFAHKQ